MASKRCLLLLSGANIADRVFRCKALSEEFSRIPRTFIDSKFRESRRLYTTYLALEQAERTYDQARNPPYQRLKCKRMGVLGPITRLTQPSDDADALAYGVEELRREIHAARKKRRKDDGKWQSSMTPAEHLY